MDLISLKIELRQELRVTPQLLQSMEILQMNSQDLLDYLNRATEENPLLEQDDAGLQKEYAELCRKVSWLDARPANAALSGDDFADHGYASSETDSLAAFLRDQLERQRLPKPLLALTCYLAELLDENGWLAQEDLDSLADLKIPADLIDRALETLQALEPAGVGARSLAECLLLQLERTGEDTPLLREVISRFLPALGQKHYGLICRELHADESEILAAETRIAALDPHPGQAFQPQDVTAYIRPDLFVADVDGELQVILNEYYLPRLSISEQYLRLLQSNPEKETRDYLRQKLTQAKSLLHGVERRSDTLQRCAEEILRVQRSFFAGTASAPAPMTLVMLADALDLHPSTISRATRGKYLQCRQGTFPLRFFFSRSLGPTGISNQQIRQRIHTLVRQEDPRHPLSDQKLCHLLEQEGIVISRRTVAKYRLALGLLSSSARKVRSKTANK